MAVSRRSTAVVTVAGAALLVVGTALGQSSAVAAPSKHAAATASGGSERVIVVLRNQLSSTPVRKNGMAARTARAESTQNAVLARLAGAKPNHVTHLSVGNAFVATVTAAQAAALAADPAVASVVKDAKIAATPSQPTAPTGHPSGKARVVRPNVNGPDAICPTDPSDPLVEPEALNTIHALSTDGSPSAQDLTRGNGVKVAYIADGIDPNNPNFIRPGGQHAIIDYKDFSGDGPNSPTGGGEAFGDASAIAAQGTVTYDLSNFVNAAYPLPAGCNIRILGVAPGASIVAIKAGGEFLTNSSILQSIDYAVRVDHVDVINESFGLSQFPDDSNRNTLKLFNDNAVAAGVTITESTGDGGVTGTIGSDAQDPQVISVRAPRPTASCTRRPAMPARGPSATASGSTTRSRRSRRPASRNFGRTIDLVAPGEADWASCEASANFASCTNFNGGRSNIEAFGGTSQSVAAHRGRGRPRDLGVPVDAQRRLAVAGAGEAHHHRYRHRPRLPVRRAGRRPAQRPRGGRGGDDLQGVDRRSGRRQVEHHHVRRSVHALRRTRHDAAPQRLGDQRRDEEAHRRHRHAELLANRRIGAGDVVQLDDPADLPVPDERRAVGVQEAHLPGAERLGPPGHPDRVAGQPLDGRRRSSG